MEGWFVLNLADALAIGIEEKGAALYPLEAREAPFRDVGVHVRVPWPGEPNALYHSEGAHRCDPKTSPANPAGSRDSMWGD